VAVDDVPVLDDDAVLPLEHAVATTHTDSPTNSESDFLTGPPENHEAASAAT